MPLIHRFLATTPSAALLVARLTLAGVMFAHGGQKLFGIWGGFGWNGTMGFFTGQLGVPAVIAALVIIGESIGAISLALGFATRFVAVSHIVILIGAITLVHFPDGYYTFEFHIAAIGLALTLLIGGAGSMSIDGWLAKKVQ